MRDVYYRYIGNVTLHMYFEANMIGKSGRIVIEIDPETKQQLYSMLALNGLNLKEWFLNNAEQFIDQKGQLQLSLYEQALPNNVSSEK